MNLPDLAKFQAVALLKPRHALSPDVFFDLDTIANPTKLRDLYPDPKSVKQAIHAFKKAGMKARTSSGYGIHVSASADVLYSICKVRIKAIEATPGSTPSYVFYDDAQQESELTSPIDTHPLAQWVLWLYLPPSPEFASDPPVAPGGGDIAWGKTEEYHVWPHELRYRLGARDPQKLQKALYYNKLGDIPEYSDKNRSLGYGVRVSMVDTGINYHEYFTSGLGIPRNSMISRLGIDTEGRAELDKLKPDVAKFKKNVDELAQRLSDLDQRLFLDHDSKLNGYPQNHVPYLKQLANKIWDSPANQIIIPWFKGASSSNPLKADNMQSILQEIRNGPDGDTLRLSIDPKGAFSELINFIEGDMLGIGVKSWVDNMSKWINSFGQTIVDFDGHGTRMAASLLGIAPNSDIKMYYGFDEVSINAYAPVIGQLNLLEGSFDRAVAEAVKLQSKISPQDKIEEYRIISNSWGTSRNVADLANPVLRAELVKWGDKVRKAVASGCVVVFSAGNAHKPAAGQFSLQACLGLESIGAIVVGGAWDKNEKDAQGSRTPTVRLSSAAHGVALAVGTDRLGKTITAQIPDICALVGPQEQYDSRYVYTPKPPAEEGGSDWDFTGGGTSSAAAQVAGVCATIRAQWPNLSPADIKSALVLGGLEVTDEQSFQKKSPRQIAARLTRVNIHGTLGHLAANYPK